MSDKEALTMLQNAAALELSQVVQFATNAAGEAHDKLGLSTCLIIASRPHGDETKAIGPAAVACLFSSGNVSNADIAAFKKAFEQMVQDARGKPPTYNLRNICNLPTDESGGGGT